MWFAVVGLLAAGTLLLPAKVVGQEPETATPEEWDEYRFEHNFDPIMRVVMNRRAKLGIVVNMQARGTDSIGAYVDAVSPGGPAASAGLRTGDIITKLDGKSVLSGGTEQDRGDSKSLPGLRLIELAAKLGPSDTVAIEYRRGKERRTVSVVTEGERGLLVQGPGSRPFNMRFWRGGQLDDTHLPAAGMIERLPHLSHGGLFYSSPLGRLELAPINPDLGAYFGTTEGVLVINAADDDSTLGLKAGDVVLSVDGRKPAGPGHLLRILRSYERGESFKLDILRHRKRETVSGRLGERES